MEGRVLATNPPPSARRTSRKARLVGVSVPGWKHSLPGCADDLRSSDSVRTSPQRCESDQSRDTASNEHPNSFIGRRSCKESGNVRTEGVGGINPHENENDATHE